MKKKFIRIVLILILVAIGIGAWRFFRAQKAVEVQKQAAAQQYTRVVEDGRVVTKPPETKQSPIHLLSLQDTLSFWLYHNEVYIMNKDGRVSVVGTEGETTVLIPISEEPIDGILWATPSLDGSRVIVRSAARNGFAIRILDTGTRTWELTDSAIQDVAFSPDMRERVQLKTLFDRTSIIETVSEKGAAREIGRIAFKDALLSFVRPDRIIVTSPPSGLFPANALSIDPTTGFISVLATEQRGLSFLWSPSGEKALAFWTDDQGAHRSAMVNTEGKVLKQLTAVFLPQKCAFKNENELLCGTPKDITWSPALVLPDAYLQHTATTRDQLISLDTQSGRVRTIYNDEGVFDIYLPQVSNNIFYFTDHTSGALYSIDLETIVQNSN